MNDQKSTTAKASADDKTAADKKTDKHKIDAGAVQEIEILNKQIEDYKTKYLRALADYQNFENRVREEKQQLIKMANADLILKLLPFLDSLEKAEIFIKDQGLIIIKNQLEKILKENGVEEIDLKGKEYDPYLAEVVEMVEGEKDNIVVEVLRKGYRYHERILRVAQVTVSKKST